MLWTEGFGTFGSGVDPWSQFEHMENEMNRVLSRFASPTVGEFPAVNIWADVDEALVTTEIPGIDPKEIDISAAGRTLTIKGSRSPVPAKADESYHRRERWYGQFSRVIELPFNVEVNNVKARFSKGILYISLPRAEAEKPKKITIKT